MANALGTLATGVIVQRALELVYGQFPLLNEITTDMSPDEVAFGQAVNTRKHVPATVEDFGNAATDRADVNIAVTMNQHKQVRHTFTVAEYSGAAMSRNLVEESALPIAIAIGQYMTAAIAALWTNTNYGGSSNQETPLASANINYSGVTSIREVLNGPTRNVPLANRFGVVLAAGFKTLLNDSTLISQQVNPSAAQSIQTAKLSGVAGFNIYEYPALPTSGTSTSTKTGVWGTKDSTIYVGRVQKDPRAVLGGAPYPGNYGVITNFETGLSVLLNEWIDPATNAANVRVSWMYGVAVGNSNNLQITRAA